MRPAFDEHAEQEVLHQPPERDLSPGCLRNSRAGSP
jgi:hypothetical protein